MPRKAIVKRRKNVAANTESELDLRRWCIEQAMRWPSESGGGYNAIGGYERRCEADIIGRAKRLRDWVTAN